jgi:hypothetical protein
VSRQNPFAFHYQGVWVERSTDPSLATWLRVAALAFGSHKKNGHATFASGELAKLLAKPGPDGVPKSPSASSVANAIRIAKRKGWIAQESNARCLVVPPHAVIGGLGGYAGTACSAQLESKSNGVSAGESRELVSKVHVAHEWVSCST